MQIEESKARQDSTRASRSGVTAQPRLSRRKRLLFRFVMLLLVLVFIEGIGWLAIWLLPNYDFRPTSEIYEQQSATIETMLEPGPEKRIELHPRLGWRYVAHFQNADNAMNSMALRSSREYSSKPGPGVLRVAAFGDSFVYGIEVDNANTWAALIEADDPKLEILNYGVGGYGIDQAYLRYTLEGDKLAPHIVVIAFTTDDLGRVVNVYRRFLDMRELVLFKPRFLIDENDELTLVEPPVRDRDGYEQLLADPRAVRRFGALDQWYRPSVYDNSVYDYSAAVRVGCWLGTQIQRRYLDSDRLYDGPVFSTTSTAFRIHVALLRKFATEAKAAGVLPVVLFLPEQESVRRARAGEATPYHPLRERLEKHGLACLDAAEAFRALDADADVKSWFAPRGHYSPQGNRIVATWLRQQLRILNSRF